MRRLKARNFGVLNSTGPTKKYCHAEFISASALDIVHRFLNEFGMTLGGKLIGQPRNLFSAGGKKIRGKFEFFL